MAKFAVVKTGGKQYLVKKNDTIITDKLTTEKSGKIRLETLAFFDNEKNDVQLGSPYLKENVEAQLIEHLKGEKIRIAKFKAKVRYRRIKGFRPSFSKIKIVTI